MIEKARSGDEEVLTAILKHYDARITALASYDVTDENGNTRRRLDEDRKAELQATLIQAIQNWLELI